MSLSSIIKQLVEYVVPEETVDNCEEALKTLNVLEAIEKINTMIFDREFELQYPGGPKVFTSYYSPYNLCSYTCSQISLYYCDLLNYRVSLWNKIFQVILLLSTKVDPLPE